MSKKVLVCLDSFKGSLTSLQAGNAVKDGIVACKKDFLVEVCPISDGGEGFLEAISFNQKFKTKTVIVSAPLGDKITSKYLVKNNTAIIEVSKCIGLNLVKEKNILNCSTYGLGEMVLDAIKNGCNNFIIGIGGSATNDGGVGFLQALGFEFLDKDNKPIKRGAIGLKDLKSIASKNVDKKVLNCTFNIACDVNNVLTGKNGASYVFAGQKGASIKEIKLMDKWLKNYAKLTKKLYPLSNKNNSGSGASGGLGFAFKEYLNANLFSGINSIIYATNLQEKIKNYDIIVVGEGKLDRQSLMGKAPCGIAKISKHYNKTIIGFFGVVDLTADLLKKSNIDYAYCINSYNQNFLDAIKQDVATKNLTATAQKVFNNL